MKEINKEEKSQEELEAEIETLKETISKHDDCLRNKDRRIKRIEKRYNNIKCSIIIFFISLSYIGMYYVLYYIITKLPNITTYFDDGYVNPFVFTDGVQAIGIVVIIVFSTIGLTACYFIPYAIIHEN